ncbi:MAG: hypothetical protein ABSF91_06390 [Bacteroidota bacterium]
MSTGQMMLVLGAMALLSIVMLSANRTYVTTGKTILYSELGITAVSLSTSVIQDAEEKAFDANTFNTPVTSLSSLTPVNSLGPESGEVYPDYNDFDDYNTLVTSKTFPSSGTFNISCSVCYVDTSNPNVASSTVTWSKKLTVTVTCPSMPDTIRESYIYSYFYFR